MSKNVPKCPNVFWGNFFKTFFSPVFHGVIESFRKNQKSFKNAKMPNIVPKIVQTCFEHVLWQFFRKKKLPRVPCRVGPSIFFQNSKKFNIPKVHKIVSKSLQMCFEHVLGQFFPTSFCPVFHGGWIFRKFSKKSKKLSKFQNCQKSFPKRVQTCFEHALWRFFRFFLPSVPCRAFQIFWTWKYELSFPDLKIRAQFSDTILKRLSSSIHATVNIRNPISDFLDLKLWDQIRELKNKSSIFWTWKVWIQFPGLKIWGRYLEKTQEKKSKKFQSSKIVQNCSQVSKRVLGQFF